MTEDTTETKECNICGADLEPDAEYCPDCGADFTQEYKYNY